MSVARLASTAERKCDYSRRHVASASGIPIFVPCPRNLWILFVHVESNIGEMIFELPCHVEARSTGVNDDNSRMTIGINFFIA